VWSSNSLLFCSTWVHHQFLVGFILLDLLFSVLFFVDFCLSFCSFSFGHCVICPSIYGFWLPIWYLRFTASDYPFGIFKLFLLKLWYRIWISNLCFDNLADFLYLSYLNAVECRFKNPVWSNQRLYWSRAIYRQLARYSRAHANFLAIFCRQQ
jgi:hypothetical protein